MDISGKDDAAARMINAHKLLHDTGRGRNLKTGDAAKPRPKTLRQSPLGRVGIGDSGRRQVRREIGICGTARMRGIDVARDRFRIECIDHR
jgi:hypothetical protein